VTDPSTRALALFSDRYNIDSVAIASVLGIALARGGDFAELFFEHRDSGSIAWEDQHVRAASRQTVQGLGIRVVKGDAIGYAYTEALDLDAMRRAADTASRIGKAEAHPLSIDATPVGALGGSYYGIDSPFNQLPAAEKVAILQRADSAARAYDPSIARVDASLFDEMKTVMVARSDGKIVGDVQPMMVMRVSALSQRDSSRRNAASSGGGRLGIEYFDRVSPEHLGRESARKAVLLQEAVDAPAGSFPVVLAAGDSGILLHEAVGHGLEADFNRKGTSNYSGRVGKSVASPLVTVIDDGTITDSRGSINIDDEGNLPQRNTLIENGILRGYLQDEISTRHFGVGPTGSGRRQSFKHYIMPRMTNTLMTAGESNPEDIIRSVEKGVYCKSFSGGQVNISNGDFVFSATEAYLIENGRITAPIRDVNLIGNGPDALSKVTMVGSDFSMADGGWTCGKDGQSVPVSIGMPTVLIDGITVGGTSVG
jgi:TldD protein